MPLRGEINKSTNCWQQIGFVFLVITTLTMSKEAQVSEFHEPSKATISSLSSGSDHIVIVAPGKAKSVLVKEVRFPKETHYSKAKESFYREYCEIYEVTEVLKSQQIKVGPIRVWTEPIYNEASVRAEHERNYNESPVVTVYKPIHEPKDSESRILFLNGNGSHADLFRFLAAEGIGSRDDIEKKLKTGLKK